MGTQKKANSQREWAAQISRELTIELRRQEVYQYTAMTMDFAAYLAELLRVYRFEEAAGQLKSLTVMIQITLDKMEAAGEVFSPDYHRQFSAELSVCLDRIVRVQEEGDYILLADVLEQELIPVLLKNQETVRMRPDFEPTHIYEEANKRFLMEHDRELYESLYGEGRERERERERGPYRYEVETTVYGFNTLKVIGEQEEFYYYSNINPHAEARLQIREWMKKEIPACAVYGLGLGNHLIWFLDMKNIQKVDVYESDPEIIRLMLAYQDRWNLETLSNYHITIHYDPDFEGIKRAMKETPDQVLLLYPGIRTIGNPDYRRIMMRGFIQDLSVRNNRDVLYANFMHNVGQYHHTVDEFREQIKGRTVVIVAAGPSLDKNLDLLVRKPGNAFIIATGTILRKLVRAGLKVDAAIISDAKQSISHQFKDIEELEIPMWLLSTASKEAAELYQGEKYLIFQKGYPLAEEYAAGRGYGLYNTGGSVSTVAMDAAVGLGAEKIVFIGLDLAFTDQKSHASGLEDQTMREESLLRPVQAYDGNGTVYSDHKFDLYRAWFTRRIKTMREQGCTAAVINATEGGSFVDGMIHMSLEDALKYGGNAADQSPEEGRE